MSDAPVLQSESEPTTTTELESALLVIRKAVDEVDKMPPGMKRAIVVSTLYRAFQELTKEVREMRDYALFDAALEQAVQLHEGDPERRFIDPIERTRQDYVFASTDFGYGADRLQYRFPTAWMDLPNGKRQIFEPFNNAYEPKRIAMRVYRRVVNRIKGERDWEAKYGKPIPHPTYEKYRGR